MTPRKRTIRTIFQVIVGLAAGLPLLLDAAGVPETATGVGVVLVVAGAITRVMALPLTNRLMRQMRLGWLAEDDPSPTLEIP